MFAVTVVQARPTRNGQFDPAKGCVSFAEVGAVRAGDAPLLTRLIELLNQDDERLLALLYTPPGS